MHKGHVPFLGIILQDLPQSITNAIEPMLSWAEWLLRIRRGRPPTEMYVWEAFLVYTI